MTDRTPPNARDAAPDGDAADARLAAWLTAALDAPTAPGPTAVPAPAEPDAARLAAHLDGPVADDALLDAAAADPDLARVLADVVVARAEAAPTGALPDAVAARARAAFGAATTAAGGEGRVVTDARWGRRAAIAAAALLVLAPLAWLGVRAGARRDAPSATFDVASVVRLHRDGRLETGGARAFDVGHAVAPAAGERLALALPGGARVILGDDDVVQVACDAASAGGCARAALALTQGEALVSAGDAASGSAVLLLPGAGRLEVTAGAVHVALGLAAVAEVALRADGRVRWSAPGNAAREWAGPGRLALHDGVCEWGAGEGDASDAAAASLFRDLAFFGGAPVSARPDRRVSARAFTVLEAEGGARASDGGAPALRFDLPAGRVARLSWTLDAVAADAQSVKVLVRVQARHSSPEGAPLPDVPLPRVVFEVEGVPGATATWHPAEEHDGRPRAARTLVLPWPADAARPRAGQPVVLRVRAERADARVWFDGAAFAFVPASAPGPDKGE